MKLRPSVVSPNYICVINGGDLLGNVAFESNASLMLRTDLFSNSPQTFDKILIANRGEIACRVRLHQITEDSQLVPSVPYFSGFFFLFVLFTDKSLFSSFTRSSRHVGKWASSL